MTTMMPAPAGAEPDAVTLQIPAIPMTWEQASIILDATFDAWRMLSGEIDAARGDDWQWIQEILALPAHTRYIKAAGDEAMVCSAAMRETWPGRWHDLLRARVQDVIDALVCIASMFVGRVRQCFSAVWADGFPRCRHRFPVM